MRRAQPGALVVALAALFVPLFALRRLGPLDFWSWMTAAGVVGCAVALWLDPGLGGELRRSLSGLRWRDAGLGVVSALALYGSFFLGAAALRRLWPSSTASIAGVYALRTGVSTARIVALLALAIAPAEEVIWRASLQRLFAQRWGRWQGVAGAAAVYAAVHLGWGNLPLAAAAGICGLFWGAMYARWRSLAANVISHALWDVLIFVAAPLG